jgi:hypothetical protein
MSDTPPAAASKTEPSRDFGVPDLPTNILQTYARLWQLETWLRRMVYVELRALNGDEWESVIPDAIRSKEADKYLTYMPTPEDSSLSYIQFSQLCDIITGQRRLFDPFLPRHDIWEIKLKEITQIRHRVAHFRVGHHDDLARVMQLLRDLDQGFWRFCTSYNDFQAIIPASDDPVASKFLHLDQFPWTDVGDGQWARIGVADPAARLGMTIQVLRRPWATSAKPIGGHEGFLFDVSICVRRQTGALDYHRLMQTTSDVHKHVVHVGLDNMAQSIRVTVPAVLGADRVISIINKFYEESLSALRDLGPIVVQEFANECPEYVLGPENPLMYLSPDMPCSFFGV